MKNIDIRIAHQKSAEELADLCSTSFADAYHGVNSDADIKTYCEKNYSVAVIKENLSNPNIIYKISYKDDEAVGFFMLQIRNCPIALGGDEIELKQIYVLASEFGTGLGKQLLDEIIKTAKRLNKRWLWLSVSDLNIRAQSFYRKHGFDPKGVAPVLKVGNDRLPATVMATEVL